MKKLFSYLLILLALVLFFACSEEELELEVYNPEAFAFQLDSEWELNVTAQVKGFQQIKEDDKYSSKLSYYANLHTPTGELLEEIDYGLVDKNSKEKLIDTQLEMQVILDSSFTEGTYTLQIFVVDDNSGQQDSTHIQFDLTK